MIINHPNDLRDRVIKVIKSCETKKQLSHALTYKEYAVQSMPVLGRSPFARPIEQAWFITSERLDAQEVCG